MQTRTASSVAPEARRWRLIPLIAAACATVALGGAAAASPGKAPAPATTYRLVQIGVSGGGNADINARGQVAFTDFVGEIPTANFYDGNSVRNLGTFGGVGAVANAVNDLGQVVGTAGTPSGPFHAFRWSRQTGLVDLNRPGVGTRSPPTSITGARSSAWPASPASRKSTRFAGARRPGWSISAP